MSSQAALTIHPASADLLLGGETESPTRAPTRERHAAEAPAIAAAPRPALRPAESSYAKPRQRRWGALAVVGGLHVLLAWALANGLAKRVVDVVRAPLETRLIEEVKTPPPPPPPDLPPPPRLAPPPPSFMPPPEIAVATPPVVAPTITTTQAPPPVVAAVAIAPPPAPPAPVAVAAAPRSSAKPARLDVGACSRPEYPAAAARAEVTGTSKIRFTVDAAGLVSRAEIERPSGPLREHRLLDQAAVAALSKCRFTPGTDEQGQPVGGYAVVDYVWKFD